MLSPKKAVIALGSNLNEPAQQIRSALATLAAHPRINIKRISSLYCTTPVGYTDQPNFINAVCLIETDLSSDDLLTALNQIEIDFGRHRSFRNAPRVLDLDIIDYDHEKIETKKLTLPHSRAHQRGFVVIPLAEIAPDYPIGEHGSAKKLANLIGEQGVNLFQEAL